MESEVHKMKVDDKIYEIVVSPQGSTGDGEVREKNMPIVEQILSTFKFTQ